MLPINKDDYKFLYQLLDKEKQDILSVVSEEDTDNIIIYDDDAESDVYDWINDLVVEKGLDENYEPNDIGCRLEKLSDYVFSIIEK